MHLRVGVENGEETGVDGRTGRMVADAGEKLTLYSLWILAGVAMEWLVGIVKKREGKSHERD